MPGIMAYLGLDGRSFFDNLKKAEVAAKGFANTFAKDIRGQVTGAFGAMALEEWVRGSVEMVANIRDLADQFGMTTDEVQKFKQAAMESGLDIEKFGSVFAKLAAARKAAGEGDENAQQAWEKFGIRMTDIQDSTLTLTDLILKLSRNLQNLKFDEDLMTDFGELTGIKGERFLAMMKGLDQTFKTTRPKFSEKTVNRLDEADDLMARGWEYVKGTPSFHLANYMNLYDVVKNWGWRKFTKAGMKQDAKDWLMKNVPSYAEDHRPPAPQPGDPNFIGPLPFKSRYTNKKREEYLRALAESQADLEQKALGIERKGMTPQEQLASYRGQINGLMNSAWFAAAEENDPRTMQRLMGEAIGLTGEMGGLQLGKSWKWAPHLSQHQAIGAYSAATSVSNPAATAIQESKNLLKTLVDLSRDLLKEARNDKFQ